MKQREVTDNENTRWSCVQAYTMAGHKSGTNIDALAESDTGNVTVVCTPTGGEKTVRLELQNNWLEEMTDDALVEAIQNEKE